MHSMSVTDIAVVAFLGILALAVVEGWIGRIRTKVRQAREEEHAKVVQPIYTSMHKYAQHLEERIERLEGRGRGVPLHPQGPTPPSPEHLGS